ncbi:DNA sulfur modification protein DndB [Xanthobacter sp. 126]|uniref:DNA sulfur modification protein DndB n=1 Tax=Xanthobacter sp. 126 TaxID=1131814 RepID=UPI00045EB739|nr:DNA sulfur modification protein DndB [Xanthobacter sp. 126]
MIPSTNGLPTPLASLDDVFAGGDTSEKPVKVFIGHNLGNRTFLMQLPMHEFYGMSEVANEPTRDGETLAQRKLDPAHAQKLATYILKGLLSAAIDYREARSQPVSDAMRAMLKKIGPQPYLSLQPVVVNIRDCNVRGEDIRGVRLIDKQTEETTGFKVFLSQRHVLWVVDGQHRRMAMHMVFAFLEQLRSTRTYPKKGNLVPFGDGEAVGPEDAKIWEECFERARTFCTVAVEVHLGLKPDEERQLFHDLNRLGKKVDTNLALQFDNSNPVNLFIKERLIDELGLGVVEADVKSWSDDDGRVVRKDLVSVNAILLLNRTNINGATSQAIEGRIDTAYWFWSAIREIDGFGEERAREKTVAAQPVVLKALAKLVFDFSFSNRRPDDGDDLTERLLSSLNDVDFSHGNPMWRYYSLSGQEREAHGLGGLAAYLPDDDGGNRDLGGFQGGVMRFGAKHNDIYPILGDMIRWKLKLPSRQKSSTSPS